MHIIEPDTTVKNVTQALCRLHYRLVPLRDKRLQHFSTDFLPPFIENKLLILQLSCLWAE